MSELRQNVITRDWVVIAPGRAKRPNDFAVPESSRKELPVQRTDCPFCVGNEDPELERYRIMDGDDWRVRVVANKFPALSGAGERTRRIEGIYRSMPGIGVQEVVIEHPRHDLTTALMSVDEVARILRAYRARYAEVRKDRRLEAIILFKNHGRGAGTSLEHPHSQLAATPVVPNEVRYRMEEATRYYDDMGECVFCRTLAEECAAGDRIVDEGRHFVAFIPYAALSPFHMWIFPRNHASSFDEIADDQIPDLAGVLRSVLARLYHGLNNPDFNYVIRSVPTHEGFTSYFHWYISVVPRVGRTAGFELGSGMFINPALPEQSAEFLRGIRIPD